MNTEVFLVVVNGKSIRAATLDANEAEAAAAGTPGAEVVRMPLIAKMTGKHTGVTETPVDGINPSPEFPKGGLSNGDIDNGMSGGDSDEIEIPLDDTSADEYDSSDVVFVDSSFLTTAMMWALNNATDDSDVQAKIEQMISVSASEPGVVLSADFAEELFGTDDDTDDAATDMDADQFTGVDDVANADDNGDDNDNGDVQVPFGTQTPVRERGNFRNRLMGHISEYYSKLLEQFGNEDVHAAVNTMAANQKFAGFDRATERNLEEAVSIVIAHLEDKAGISENYTGSKKVQTLADYIADVGRDESIPTVGDLFKRKRKPVQVKTTHAAVVQEPSSAFVVSDNTVTS